MNIAIEDIQYLEMRYPTMNIDFDKEYEVSKYCYRKIERNL